MMDPTVNTPSASELTRRERQIMEVLWRRQGEVTASEVQADLPDPPSYSAVRTLLRILEGKGHLTHRRQGPRYVYRPTVSSETARRSALRRLVDIFFQGSISQTATALLDLSERDLDPAELDRLADIVDTRRQEGR